MLIFPTSFIANIALQDLKLHSGITLTIVILANQCIIINTTSLFLRLFDNPYGDDAVTIRHYTP